jgi:hypothetical protein
LLALTSESARVPNYNGLFQRNRPQADIAIQLASGSSLMLLSYGTIVIAEAADPAWPDAASAGDWRDDGALM